MFQLSVLLFCIAPILKGDNALFPNDYYFNEWYVYITKSPIYELLYFAQVVGQFLDGFLLIIGNCFVISIINYLCVEFEILSIAFKRLSTKVEDPRKAEKILKDLIREHQELLK